MMNHPEIKSQDFTTKKNDDTIKVSVKQYRRFLGNTQFLLTAGRI